MILVNSICYVNFFSTDSFHRKGNTFCTLGNDLTCQSVKAMIKNGMVAKVTVTHVLPAVQIQTDI